MNIPDTEKIKQYELILPLSTIAKILGVLLFVYCIKILAPLLMTLFIGVLLAISLEPVLDWLEMKKLRRFWAISLITLVLTGLLALFAVRVVPQLFGEIANFFSDLPKIKNQILDQIPNDSPLRPLIESGFSKAIKAPTSMDITPIFAFGNFILGGFTEVILVFVFSIYLLIDGKSALSWIKAFFSESNQQKLQMTADEISPIVSAYVMGQLITSLISFFYVLVVLNGLGVPNSLLLATLAGIFDVLPVLGFFLAVVPAMLFAWSVSPNTVGFVLAFYVLYHAIENYFIVPWIYGKRLRVSGFVVLVTLVAAGMLAGIEGAIVVLPVVASYPIFERLWLKKVVGKATIDEHKTLVNES